MTHTLLTHLSRKTTSGEGLWAILTAREYLEPADPLWIALKRKTEKRLAAVGAQNRPLVKSILNGAKIIELGAHARDEIRAIDAELANQTPTVREELEVSSEGRELLVSGARRALPPRNTGIREQRRYTAVATARAG